MPDVKKTSVAGKTEVPAPEPQTNPADAPPEANVSGPESSASVPGLRNGKTPAKRRGIEGAKRLVCKRCNHFLGEVKSRECEVLILCHRCKTENLFALQELL